MCLGVYFVRITLTFVKVLLNYIMISYFEIDIDHWNWKIPYTSHTQRTKNHGFWLILLIYLQKINEKWISPEKNKRVLDCGPRDVHWSVWRGYSVPCRLGGCSLNPYRAAYWLLVFNQSLESVFVGWSDRFWTNPQIA